MIVNYGSDSYSGSAAGKVASRHGRRGPPPGLRKGAPDTLGPAMLAHQGEALGVVDQGREIDQVGSSHPGEASSRGRVRVSYTKSCCNIRGAEPTPSPTSPPRNPIRAIDRRA